MNVCMIFGHMMLGMRCFRHTRMLYSPQLEALRSVLDDCPKDEVFGMFELSRARLIEVGPHVACLGSKCCAPTETMPNCKGCICIDDLNICLGFLSKGNIGSYQFKVKCTRFAI